MIVVRAFSPEDAPGVAALIVPIQREEFGIPIALLDIGNSQAALRKMFVAPAFRGREHGTAKFLLDELLAWSRTQRLRDIYLGTTAKFLAAHRFYEKHGFREIAREDLPAAFPVMKVDTKFYRRSLP